MLWLWPIETNGNRLYQSTSYLLNITLLSQTLVFYEYKLWFVIAIHKYTNNFFISLYLQLYKLGDEPDRKEFLDELFAFLESKGKYYKFNIVYSNIQQQRLVEDWIL